MKENDLQRSLPTQTVPWCCENKQALSKLEETMKSQDHGMVCAGKDLKVHLGPSPAMGRDKP